VLKEWQAGFAGIAVTLLMSALIVLDLNYGAFRCWWSGHAFTTDAVAGILVVLITALIIRQILRLRRQRPTIARYRSPDWCSAGPSYPHHIA
jgi:cytochrome c biogenesis factor